MVASMNKLVSIACDCFWERYQDRPEFVVAAPGRVNLIGEHTDYNNGWALPMAIDRYTVIAAGANPSVVDGVSEFEFFSEQMQASTSFTTQHPPPNLTAAAWSAYVQGVLTVLDGAGITTPPLRGVIVSSVPSGAGLSSSAALEVSIAKLALTASKTPATDVQIAQWCQTAEHQYAGVPCGVMDQICSVSGVADHCLLLDCKTVTWQTIPIDSEQVAILVVDSLTKHSLAATEYALRRRECQRACEVLQVESLRDATLEQIEKNLRTINLRLFARARHVVTENARVHETARHLSEKNWGEAGRLMYASHQSLCNDYEVSCRELDQLVEIAQSIGVSGGLWGARMTGGGFGGCIIALIDAIRAKEICEQFASKYKNQTGRQTEPFIVRPAQGAFVVRS